MFLNLLACSLSLRDFIIFCRFSSTFIKFCRCSERWDSVTATFVERIGSDSFDAIVSSLVLSAFVLILEMRNSFEF